MVKRCAFFAVRTESLNYLDELWLQRVNVVLLKVCPGAQNSDKSFKTILQQKH
jgi:hypothetical protein